MGRVGINLQGGSSLACAALTMKKFGAHILFFCSIFTVFTTAEVLAMDHASQRLEDLEKVSSTAESERNVDRMEANAVEVNAGIEKLIQFDQLVSADDFHRAGKISAVFYENEILNATRKYQLILTALALGNQDCKLDLANAWDLLMSTTGRYGRIGTNKRIRGAEIHEDGLSELAPESIRQVYLNPKSAIAAAAKAKDSSEVKQIVDADQKCRQVEWNKLSSDELKKFSVDDKARYIRIKQIVESGVLKTAADFENAALVCQHGKRFLDYALAHELSICAILLGSKNAIWLSGASYDRMLLSASYPQRFDTQYIGNLRMQVYTTEGVNDRMRSAVVHKTLAESLARQIK